MDGRTVSITSICLGLTLCTSVQAATNFAPAVRLSDGTVDVQFGGLARIGDVDADGRPDLHVSAGSGSAWHLNRLPDGFPLAPAPLSGVPYSLRDIDGDGLPDQVVTGIEHLGTGDLRTYLWVRYGTGGGSFAAEVAYPLGDFPGGRISMNLHDRDDDGDADLTLFVGARYTTYRNDGSVFTPLQAGDLAPDALGFVMSGDLDADGRIDFLVGNLILEQQTVMRGAADGSLTPAPGLLPHTSSITGLWTSDFDGDGDQDVLLRRALSSPTQDLQLLLRQPGGGLVQSDHFRGADARAFADTFLGALPELHDLDGDGRMELVAQNGGQCDAGPFACPAVVFAPDAFSWLSFDPAGRIHESPAFEGGLLTVADVDGDGRADAVGVDATGAVVWRRGIQSANSPPVVPAVQSLRIPLRHQELTGWLHLGAEDADQQRLTFRVVGGPTLPFARVVLSGGWLYYQRGEAGVGGRDRVEIEVDDGAGGVTVTRVEVQVDGLGGPGEGGGGTTGPAALALWAALLLLRRRAARRPST